MADDWEEVRRNCERGLGSQRPRSAAQELRAAAEALDVSAEADHYGSGEVVEGFENELAALLGKEAAVLFPTGTMAQQIALRLHCDRRGTPAVAFHPTCHLELHEHAAYAHLHGLRAELIGHRDRLISLDDLKALREPVGAVLLELPQREIGGQLPEWEDLLEQMEWVRERGAGLHLDGARIWEAAPYYGRPHAEIADLFDTVYVSLYKALHGLAGCVLAGPEEIVEQARVWRRRHGGDLFHMFPLVAAARRRPRSSTSCSGAVPTLSSSEPWTWPENGGCGFSTHPSLGPRRPSAGSSSTWASPRWRSPQPR